MSRPTILVDNNNNNNNNNSNRRYRWSKHEVIEHTAFPAVAAATAAAGDYAGLLPTIIANPGAIIESGTSYTAYNYNNQYLVRICRTTSADMIARAMQEREIYARLNRPGQTYVDTLLYASITEAGPIVFLFEYRPGKTLQQIISSGKKFTFRTVNTWRKHLLVACDYMAECGVIHRDLKPANIYVPDGALVPYVFDFESGCITDDGICKEERFWGTRIYATPSLKTLIPNADVLSKEYTYSVYSDKFAVMVIAINGLSVLLTTADKPQFYNIILRYLQPIIASNMEKQTLTGNNATAIDAANRDYIKSLTDLIDRLNKRLSNAIRNASRKRIGPKRKGGTRRKS